MPNRRVLKQRRPYLLYRGGSSIDFLDYGVATAGLRKIKHFAEQGHPFMISLGFFRPHLPLACPEEYWAHFDNHSFTNADNDRYWKDTFTDKLPPGMNPERGSETRHYAGVIGNEDGTEESGVREESAYSGPGEGRNPAIRQAYYATARFIDSVVARVVDELDKFNAETRNNTHIIITSDHGFLLGEYGRIGKWTLAEAATRVPLVIIPSLNLRAAIPKIRVGTRVTNPVDQIDVFPTVSKLHHRILDYGINPSHQVMDMVGINPRGESFIAGPLQG